MNRQTVRLLRVFKRVHPGSARMDCNKACYACAARNKPNLRYGLKFWVEESLDRMHLYGECTFTNIAMGAEELKAKMAELKLAREGMCAQCPSRSDTDACDRLCLFIRLSFSDTAITFTHSPVPVTETAEAAFRAMEFQHLAMEVIDGFISYSGFYIMIAEAKGQRKRVHEPPPGFEGFHPGEPKN